MFKPTLSRVFALVAMLASGCGDAPVPADTNDAMKNLMSYGGRLNGTGIHIGSTQPESWVGLANTSTAWSMTGFSRHADGSIWATGWYTLGVAVISADALLTGAQLNGVSTQVKDIRTTGSQLSIDVQDAASGLRTLRNEALVGLSLVLRVPDALGLTTSQYKLRISSSENIDSQFGDVSGYQVDVYTDGLLGGSWSSYCKGPGGASQRSVFYQGSQWSPVDATRTDGANLVTMTCESGSVAKCMRWGYRPWASANTQSGQSATAADYHQACIHMKRASYCGDSQAHTVDGTSIFVSDQQSPPINSGSLASIEALWTVQGATCVTNRRHPEILFLGCPLPLPTCPANPSSGYLLATGLTGSSSLLGLLD